MIINSTIGGGITPSGSMNITENGTYDVTDKASAVVNVSGEHGYKEFTFVNASDVSSGYVTLVSGDTDVAAHYAAESASAHLIANSPSTEANTITTMHGYNIVVGGSGANLTYRQIGTWHGATAFALFGMSGAVGTGSTASRGVAVNSSGDIMYRAANNGILKAGTYTVIFQW